MKHIILTIVLLAATGLSSACLVRETQHTIYLEPDGRVTWTVMETGIQSVSRNPAERDEEEISFLAEATRGQHCIALALAGLNPHRLTSRVLRAERPYAVWTDASFPALDQLAQAIGDRLGLDGQAQLWREGSEMKFEWTVREDPAGGSGGADECLMALLAEKNVNYRLVLTRGCFTSARGFVLSADGREAVPAERDSADPAKSDEPITIALSWQIDSGE